MDEIKPQTMEGFMIRLSDQFQYMNKRFDNFEDHVSTWLDASKIQTDNIEKRVLSIECKMTHREGAECGVKEVKTSIKPYILALLSAVLSIGVVIFLVTAGYK